MSAPTDKNILKAEIEYFEELRPRLLETNKGQYALIKGREFVGGFTKPEEAYEEGINRFGITPFLIKQILHILTVIFHC